MLTTIEYENLMKVKKRKLSVGIFQIMTKKQQGDMTVGYSCQEVFDEDIILSLCHKKLIVGDKNSVLMELTEKGEETRKKYQRTMPKTKLEELLIGEGEKISLLIKAASIEGRGNTTEISDRIEPIISDFFRRYYPFPYKITKGIVVDSFDVQSGSIDCLILDPTHPNTIDVTTNKPNIVFADGTNFAIEHKTKLYGDEAIETVCKQCQKLKKVKRIKSCISPEQIKDHQRTIPYIIFIENTNKNARELLFNFVKKIVELQIKPIEQFDMIVVNQKQ